MKTNAWAIWVGLSIGSAALAGLGVGPVRAGEGAGQAVGGQVAPAPAGQKETPGEKLLFGFERAEVEKAAAGLKTKDAFGTLENGDLLLKPPQSTEGAGLFSGIAPMQCVRQEPTQGQYCVRVPNEQAKGVGLFFNHPIAEYPALAQDPATNQRLPEVFNTYKWFDAGFDADWSGYDLFRIDVKVARDRPATLIVELEDDLVEPPVSQTYQDIKPGGWVTLELDLAKAVADRKLNLARLRNIFVRFDGRKEGKELKTRAERMALADFVIYLDNIRLAKKAAPCPLPVLAGERSGYTLTLPRSYALEFAWSDAKASRDVPGVVLREPMPKPAKPQTGEPVILGPPARIGLAGLLAKSLGGAGEKALDKDALEKYVVVKGVTAASSKAMLVSLAYVGGGLRFDKPMLPYPHFPHLVAVATTDGGKTWASLDGGEVPTWLHKGRKAWDGTVFDGGADLMGLHDDGCLTFRTAFEGYCGDRTYFWRTIFGGDRWRVSHMYFLSGEPRHCVHGAQNIVQLPSGRLWCVWGSKGRDGAVTAWAKYSDDEGSTWQSWLGAGMAGPVPLRGLLFPHGDHVGMIVGGRGGGRWTVFDGQAWSAPAEVPVKAPVQAVGCGRDVYVIDKDGPLCGYDGKQWKAIDLPGREDYPRFYQQRMQSPGGQEWKITQYFSVCGDTVLFVEPDKTGKKILCWRKGPGAAWTGPQEVVTEETPIADVMAPRYGLTSFTPVAYNCFADDSRGSEAIGAFKAHFRRDLKPWVKVLCVPAAGKP